VSETVSIIDLVSGQMLFASTVGEGAHASETATPQTDFVALITENAHGGEINTVAPSVFSAIIVEFVTLTDVLTARFLWEEVDDSQSITWTPVDDSQAVVWVETDGSQSPDWQDIATLT
jgi:hypothetical protein